MMAIKLVSLTWNKTLLISFVADDENWSVFKRRFNCQTRATLTTAMTIAGMLYSTADTIYRVSNSSNSIMCWTFDSVAIVKIVIMTAQSGIFSVFLEKGRFSLSKDGKK